LITGGLFLCLTHFLWGKVSDLSASPSVGILWFADFQFCSVICLWMLLTGSGDELCGLLPALIQEAAYHLPTVGPSFQTLLKAGAEISSLLFHPSCARSATRFSCVSFQLLIVVFFCGSGGSVCPRGYAGLS
jgi:hypothetical protein